MTGGVGQLVWNVVLVALLLGVVLACGWSLWVFIALLVVNFLGYVEGRTVALLEERRYG